MAKVWDGGPIRGLKPSATVCRHSVTNTRANLGSVDTCHTPCHRGADDKETKDLSGVTLATAKMSHNLAKFN